MKRKILISALGLTLFLGANAQKLPVNELNTFFTKAFNKVSNGIPENSSLPGSVNEDGFHSGVRQAVQKLHSLRDHIPITGSNRSDTLIIGYPPNDSLIITGDYTLAGPVIVVGNGILRFRNARSTIIGDVWVWGDHALVTSDSSYLYFPQEYFYQRSLVIVGKGRVEYDNTTLDFSGLSHNLLIMDSGSIRMNHVKDIGFTTCGLYGTPRVDIENSDEQSEYVITDKARLTFKNDKTLLLWHQVPDTGMLDVTFPRGDTLFSYHFNDTSPGTTGIHYQIDIDTCYNVMWALMPSSGSDVTISDSKLRSVGLWFEGHDTINVSGLVDNSSYSSYTADLPDRYLHFENSSVQTWSLYPMDSVLVNVTGCILGEIGTEKFSRLVANDIYVDGSGGYWWSTDTTFMISGYSAGANAIRSSGASIFLFAYSTLTSGDASAMGNSILMLVQSQLPEEPKLYDGSCVWNAYIGKPSSAFVDTLVPVHGSAWIDKTAVSKLMGLTWYQLFYLHLSDTSWIPVQGKMTEGKYDEIIGNWDTHGLLPGGYALKLVLCDITADSNRIEAVKAINLLPRIIGVNEINNDRLIASIAPNPINQTSLLTIESDKKEELLIKIIDLSGKLVFKSGIKLFAGRNNFRIGELDLKPGGYYCILETEDGHASIGFIKK
ncbi:MAG: T9SS type A sorting domain-containing protein [Bacteroidetes bacterium]|nr:T9SS type A sorting domain-containing protein [Bacteroidota bacterium]